MEYRERIIMINKIMRKIQVTGWSFVKTHLTPNIDMLATFQRKDGSSLTVDIGQNDIADRLKDFNSRHPQ